MRIGDQFIHEGRLFVLIGLDPMGVAERSAELEDPATGERVNVPVSVVEEGGGFRKEG
jgi:hypothetical protein